MLFIRAFFSIVLSSTLFTSFFFTVQFVMFIHLPVTQKIAQLKRPFIVNDRLFWENLLVFYMHIAYQLFFLSIYLFYLSRSINWPSMWRSSTRVTYAALWRSGSATSSDTWWRCMQTGDQAGQTQSINQSLCLNSIICAWVIETESFFIRVY